MDVELECWAEVPGYPEYEASTFGHVRRAFPTKQGKPPRILKHAIGSSGYSQISLFADGKCQSKDVHRIIARTFLGPCPDGMEVGHKDNDRQNCRLDNLVYCTPKQNHEHRMARGKAMRGSDNGNALMNEMIVRVVKRLPGMPLKDLARIFGVSPAAIWTVRTGRAWRHVANVRD